MNSECPLAFDKEFGVNALQLISLCKHFTLSQLWTLRGCCDNSPTLQSSHKLFFQITCPHCPDIVNFTELLMSYWHYIKIIQDVVVLLGES